MSHLTHFTGAATLAVTTPDFNHVKSQASSAVMMQSPVPGATDNASSESANNLNTGQVLPDGGLENGITHEDEDVADDLVNGSGSTKRKKKSKSQKVKLGHEKCKRLSVLC